MLIHLRWERSQREHERTGLAECGPLERWIVGLTYEQVLEQGSGQKRTRAWTPDEHEPAWRPENKVASAHGLRAGSSQAGTHVKQETRGRLKADVPHVPLRRLGPRDTSNHAIVREPKQGRACTPSRATFRNARGFFFFLTHRHGVRGHSSKGFVPNGSTPQSWRVVRSIIVGYRESGVIAQIRMKAAFRGPAAEKKEECKQVDTLHVEGKLFLSSCAEESDDEESDFKA